MVISALETVIGRLEAATGTLDSIRKNTLNNHSMLSACRKMLAELERLN